ncbi:MULTISPECIES: GntR family transcriptional regulator [Pontibacillus]|uniref:GntR family transcriptional regulator n=1 Tax=Pontibacillus chungwhensis TaxID=265426 RepID=A0ABY8UYC9_9BACI|nr:MULTISPECIES: GntR family transcriptional regulator [Pontibacillus]MCD5325396.1 GntR family transcriptional regulator [Pontibacillus sp. HN14]WIF98512.1 GntR family transcriptional regulator [Pontibacillus chungwhensis]
MYIQIEPDSDIPIYSQVSTQVMEEIIRGELQAGDVLPSVRGLAGDLGVNMHTINKSYHDLEAKGVITIVPKSGAVINADPTKDISKEQHDRLSEKLRPTVVEAMVSGMNDEQIHALVDSIMRNVREMK